MNLSAIAAQALSPEGSVAGQKPDATDLSRGGLT